MKKKLSFILAAVFGLVFVMLPFFAVNKNSKTFTAEAATNGEAEFFIEGNSFDLISNNPTGDIGNCTIENTAPFNPETKSVMSGSSITPASDEYGQILNSVGFRINNYQPSSTDVIYMWVYLIDAISFKLKIELNSGSATGLVWEFDSTEVYQMGTGWKILALCLSDFSSDAIETDKIYNSIAISYYSEFEDYKNEEGYQKYNIVAKENFSIYHIFYTKNVNLSQNSGIVYSLGNSFYEFSDKFTLSNTVYIGDKLKINSADEIFKYLYIGKYNLSTYLTTGNYYWSLFVKPPESTKTQVEFGENINFIENGFYTISIELTRKGTLTNNTILSESFSIYCDELKLGHFLMGSNYKIKDDESVLLLFKLANNISIVDEISVSVNNDNAKVSYYEENGTLYILVSGCCGGSSSVNVSAKAKSDYGTKTANFTASASIEIESTEEKTDAFVVILWITFGCFCVFFVVYLLISLVKARKNDVK